MIIKINDCGRGVNADLMPEELETGVWSDCQNMRFGAGFAERFGGMTNIFGTPSVIPYFITQYLTQTAKYWIHAGLSAVYADDGSTRTDITGTTPTGDIDDRWTGTSLNNVLVMNNGVDVPTYWGGNTSLNLATLPGWDSSWRAQSIRAYKGALVAVNITKGANSYPSMVKTSSIADPGSVPSNWDETDPQTLAIEYDLAETGDVCLDLLAMGDQMIIYKNSSMYAMTLGSADEVYRFQRLPGNDGILARGCAVDTPLGHVVLTSNDVVIHQGQGARSIADGRVRDYIFSNMNRTTPERAFVCVNPPRSEVLICFPSEASETCDKAAVWNWRYDTWGFKDLPSVTYGASGQVDVDALFLSWDGDSDTWDSDTTTWSATDFSVNEQRLLFTRDTAISAFDVATLELGSTMNAYAERKGIGLEGDGYGVMLLTGAYPRIDAPAGTVVQLQFGGQMTPVSEPSYSDPVDFTVGVDDKVDTFASGKYLAMKVSSSVDAIWKMRTIKLDVQQDGTY